MTSNFKILHEQFEREKNMKALGMTALIITAILNAETKKNIDRPIVNTPPKVVKPKAVYAGGKNPNNGGNNADSYNNIRNQGIAGGNGDQGKPNGNPNSDSYTGNGGTGNGG